LPASVHADLPTRAAKFTQPICGLSRPLVCGIGQEGRPDRMCSQGSQAKRGFDVRRTRRAPLRKPADLLKVPTWSLSYFAGAPAPGSGRCRGKPCPNRSSGSAAEPSLLQRTALRGTRGRRGCMHGRGRTPSTRSRRSRSSPRSALKGRNGLQVAARACPRTAGTPAPADPAPLACNGAGIGKAKADEPMIVLPADHLDSRRASASRQSRRRPLNWLRRDGSSCSEFTGPRSRKRASATSSAKRCRAAMNRRRSGGSSEKPTPEKAAPSSLSGGQLPLEQRDVLLHRENDARRPRGARPDGAGRGPQRGREWQRKARRATAPAPGRRRVPPRPTSRSTTP